ncbi:MAG: cyclic nucleotide-binding domain-containing protein [Pseudomonadota bacterium]
MTLQKDVEVLRGVPLFAKVEPSKLKLLAFTSEHLEFLPGDIICQQGDVGDAAYVLLEGNADILVDNQNGQVKVTEIKQHDIVGEIAILCDVPRTATVAATTRVSTMRISKDGFFNLVTQFPQVGVEVMHELASRLHHTTQRLTEASSKLRQVEGTTPI